VSAPESKVAYATFRVYRQKDGSYVAYGDVERTDTDLKAKRQPSESAQRAEPAAALAEVLESTGFLK